MWPLVRVLRECMHRALDEHGDTARLYRADFAYDQRGHPLLALQFMAMPPIGRIERMDDAIPSIETTYHLHRLNVVLPREAEGPLGHYVRNGEISRLCEQVFSEVVEDRSLKRELDEAQQRLAAMGPDLRAHPASFDLYQRYIERGNHYERHHSEEAHARRYGTVTEVRARQQQRAHELHELMLGAMTTSAPNPMLGLTALDALAYFHYQTYTDSKEAAEKGWKLLLEYLTPDQAAMLKEKNYFEVKGSDSGKTYRINKGRQMNIYELDNKGEPVRGWCFLPAGNLCDGDTMLAQKIALECEEKKALKVANEFAVGGASGLGIEEYARQLVAMATGRRDNWRDPI